MKKNDIALIILITSITLVISYLVVKALFGEPAGQQTTVEKVESIASTIQEPSARIFNANAINPTVVIQIGNPSNQQPFNGQ
ncbi:MAG TPA: hypothetical protein VFT87_03440 [Candidatus Saccharimonadales bacterium]|nr:hypothetical protein [Candidatus Saccharimonadales bacterium]